MIPDVEAATSVSAKIARSSKLWPKNNKIN